MIFIALAGTVTTLGDCKMSLSTDRLWSKEFSERGNRDAIASRLAFHGGLNVDDVVRHTGLSPQTVRKHLDALVADGRATKLENQDHWRWAGGSDE